MRSTKIIKICSSSLCTCLHHMVILRTRNKITDFLMILAWASPFNQYVCYVFAIILFLHNHDNSHIIMCKNVVVIKNPDLSYGSG